MLKPLPPYLSFRTFSSFLAELRVREIPERIDRSFLRLKSSAAQSQLLSALRYFGLIDDHGVPTKSLSDLTHAKGRESQELWKGILRSSYSTLSELEVETATTDQIKDAFWKEGVRSQETLRKALSFYCLAARNAGVQLSPHIRPYAGRRNAKPAESDTNENRIIPFPQAVQRKSDSSRLELALKRFPEFNPSWTEAERTNWLEGFKRVVRIVEGSEESTKQDSAAWKSKP